MSYEVKLEAFEGPLDLLLHLIKKHEIDIYDIPIALITKQYLGYLDLMKTLNLDIAGEFLLMAASLMYIKSKMLLPPSELDEELIEEDEEDPRAELVRKLLEYKKYKDVVAKLEERRTIQDEIFQRENPPDIPLESDDFFVDVSLFDLISAFKSVLEQVSEEEFQQISVEKMDINEKISEIMERLQEAKSLVFQELFNNVSQKAELIITFLALLELIRLKLVRAQQVKQFGAIRFFVAEPLE